MIGRIAGLLLLLAAVTCILCFTEAKATWWDDRSAIRGSGDVVEEDREIGTIHSVNLATIGTLYIEVGDDEGLTIRAEDNLLKHIETDVTGGRLLIRTEDRVNLRPRSEIKYYLTVKALDMIVVSSSGDIKTSDLEAEDFTIMIESSGNLETGAIQCGNLEIEISSSGDVYIDALNARTITAEMSSSGDLEIGDGQVEEQSISINSSGDYNAMDLSSNEARVRINSSGDATVRVRDYLDARTNSSGDVNYYGDPETVDRRESSSGDVERIGG